MLTVNDFLDANSTALLTATALEPQLTELLLGLEQVSSTMLFKLNYYRLRLTSSLIHYYSGVCGDFGKSLALQMDLMEGYRFNLGPVSMAAFLALMEATEWCVKIEDWTLLGAVIFEAEKMAKVLFQENDAYFASLKQLGILCESKGKK